MDAEAAEGRDLARVHLACGRIAGLARAIGDAHRFGVREGPHDRLWERAYHLEAVRVYGKSLPAPYQRDIASLFHHSIETMAEQTVPARLAEDWTIVAGYMGCAAAAIMEWLASAPAKLLDRGAARESDIEDHTPSIVRFDHLAELCSRAGVCRLEEAAVAVQCHVGAPSARALDDAQRRLLQRVASGAPIVDLAEELGYSRSSMYREMSKLWRALGVSDRAHAIRRAAEEGLLD